MPLYHNSPDGPRRCKALRGGCPYAIAGEPHFNNVQDARQAYESDLQQKFGSHYAQATLSKKGLAQKSRESYYSKLDLGQVTPRQDRAIRAMRALAKGGARTGAFTAKAVGRTGLAAAKMSSRMASSIASGAVGGRRGSRGHSTSLKKLLLTKYWLPDPHSSKWRTSRYA